MLDAPQNTTYNLFNSSHNPLDILKQTDSPLCRALHQHARWGNTKEVAQLIEAYPALIKATDELGNTALHWAFKYTHINTIKKLIALGANINAQLADKKTPLHLAALQSNTELLMLLLSHRADVTIRDEEGNTALHAAVSVGFSEGVTLLIKANSDINSHNNYYGNTPLHLAMIAAVWNSKHIRLVDLLVKHGADPTLKNLFHLTPAKHAALLKQNVLPPTGLKKALHTFFKKEIPIPKGEKGMTPVHLYIQAGDFKAALKWIEYDPELIHDKDYDDNTPLHAAAKYNSSREAFKKLIDLGGDINAPNEHGDTPLHCAIQTNNEGAINVLIEIAQKNPTLIHLNHRNKMGLSPFHEAVRHNYIYTAELLIACGVNLNTKDQHGNTPLHDVIAFSNWDPTFKNTAVFLLKYGAKNGLKNDAGNTPQAHAEQLAQYYCARPSL
jgi:ankyrin repeat protein